MATTPLQSAPKNKSVLITGISIQNIQTGRRFYQILAAFGKRLPIHHRADFKRLLTQAGVVMVVAVLIFAVSNLYFLWPPFGLKVTYFRGTNFEEKICSRTEQAVNRDYGEKSPAWGVPSNNFSACWEGILRVPKSDDYYFFSQSDDGLRLIIDGEKIINNWRDQSWEASATGVRVYLEAGDHPIAIEHYNSAGESALRIKWSGGPIAPNTILSAPFVIPRASTSTLWCVFAGIILKVALFFAVLILPGYCILRWLAKGRLDRDQAFLLAAPATIVLLGLIFVALFSLGAPGWVHQIIYVFVIITVGALAVGRKVRTDISGLSGACQAGLLFAFLSVLISVCFVVTAGNIHPAVAVQGWPEVALRNPSHPMPVDNGIQYYAGLTFARHLEADAFSPYWGSNLWKISDRPPLLGILYAIELLATGSSSFPLYLDYEILGIVLNSLYLIPLYLLFARLFQDRRMAGWIAAAVMLNIFVFVNTWYTWPKLMGVYFALTAVFYVMSHDGFRRRDALVTGVCLGLAALSHGGAMLSLPCLMLYQGIALWRRGKTVRHILAVGGLALIFGATFLAVQLSWNIYKARHSPDRNILIKMHYFPESILYQGYTVEYLTLNPDLINKCLTRPVGHMITAFVQTTTLKEQCQHRLANLATSLRTNGFAELYETILSRKWGPYFATDYLFVFSCQLPVVGLLNIVFGALFLVIYFVRGRIARLGCRKALKIDMPRLLILLSFAIVSLIFNILLKWSVPYNHVLPYLELVFSIALMAGFAFSLHPVVRIILMAFIGLRFFHYAYYATVTHGYSIFDFFGVAMMTAVIVVLLIPLFPFRRRSPQTTAE